MAGKAVGLASRSVALARWARGRAFDVAMGHGSNDVMVAAKLLRIPSATAFDYEWATIQHNVNCRLGRAVVVPEAIPPERLERYGAKGKLRRYAGLKEEYYLADFEPDPAVLGELGLDPRRADHRRAHAARRVALPPLREPAVRPRAREIAGHADGRSAANSRSASGDRGTRRLHHPGDARSTPRA